MARGVFPSSSRRGAAAGGGVVGCSAQTTPALRATPAYPRSGKLAGLRNERSLRILANVLVFGKHRFDDHVVADSAAQVAGGLYGDLRCAHEQIRSGQML